VVDPKCKDQDLSYSADDCDTDESSNLASELDDGEPSGGHLVLARHRVFSPHLQTKFQDCYRIVRLLGEGSYGNVYEASTVAPGSSAAAPGPAAPRRVAAKCFSLQQAESGIGTERNTRELASRRASFERERSILCRLEHPHLVRMYECFEDKGNLWIVLELCRGGELYECIAEKVRSGQSGGLGEEVGRVFFRQMLYAISYLHACHVVHRDVKTENFLLLGEPGTPNGDVIKLCDFGTAVVLSPQQPRAMERIGTLSYTAPEVYERRGATVLADAWSLGACLYVLLVGASPFRISGDEPRGETVRRIQAGDYDRTREAWLNSSREAQDLVSRLLVVDESARLSSAEALRHPWVEVGNMSVLLSVSRQAQPMRASPRGRRPSSSPLDPQVVLDVEGGKALLRLLWRFARLDALQQLVLIVCAQMTSEEELMQCREPVPWYDLFFALDSNEDGRIDFAEFVQGLVLVLDTPANTVPAQHLDALARALDLDCSGAVDWVEWVAIWLLSRGELSTEQEPLQTAFRLLDRPSGDGTLGAADLLAVVSVGAGIGLPTRYGREVAHQILGKWVTPSGSPGAGPDCIAKRARPRGRRNSSHGAAPALRLADVQRALEATIGMVADEDETVTSLYTPRSPSEAGPLPMGCFACCMANQGITRMGAPQVLVSQHRATGSPRRGGAGAAPSPR